MSNADRRVSRRASRHNRFTAADAALHHPAAAFMAQQDRQAWAREANKAIRRGKTIKEAVAEANFTLNALLDHDADSYLGASPEYIALTNIEVELQGDRRVLIDDPLRPATGRRMRDRDYYTAEFDIDRHPQLRVALERQRRAAGQPQ